MNHNEISVEDRLIIAFVQGAQFWLYHSTGFTAFSSGRHKMEEQAEYLLQLGELGRTITERLHQKGIKHD